MNKLAKQKIIYRIKGMNCDACSKMIELELEDSGFKASCDYAKETLEVEINGDESLEKKVKQIVERSGYKLVKV